MSADRFEAEFSIDIDREAAWRRLTAHHPEGEETKLWLAGFDAVATIVDADRPGHLHAVKDHDPCGGTHIEVTLVAEDNGTHVHVVQSAFGDWLAAFHEIIGIGWRHIVADLHAYLATGVHIGRHGRPWGDLGADAGTARGGVLIATVQPGGLADRLGLLPGDLLVMLSGAPMTSLDDVFTALRILQRGHQSVDAEWIRSGALMTGSAPLP